MADGIDSGTKTRRAGKWLLWFGASLLMLIAFIAVAVFFLPQVVSTEWFRNRLEQQASQSLHRPVEVDSLTWTWSRGIILEGVRIPDDPELSQKPLFELEYAHLFVDLKNLLRRRILFDVDVDGLAARLIKGPDGRTNLERLLAPFEPSEEEEPEPSVGDWRTLTFEAPKEMEGRVRLNNLSLLYEDRVRGSTLKADEGSLQLDIPSMDQPIELKTSLNLEVDGKPLQGVTMSARIENFTDTHGRIALTLARTHMELNVPGGRVLVDGSLEETSLDTRIHLDLAQLLKSVEPFLPVGLPTCTGSVDLSVTAKAPDPETFLFDTKVAAIGLEISGGPLKAGRMGPADLKVFQDGAFHRKKDLLEVKSGELQLQKNCRLAWRGNLEGLSQAKPIADIHLGPVSLDLGQLLTLVQPLLPASLALPKGRNGEMINAELLMDALRLTGPVPEGPNQVEIEGVSLTVPGLVLDLPGGAASLDKVVFLILRGEAGIEAGLPSRFRLSANCGVERFELSGSQPMSFEKLELTPVEISGEDLAPSENTLFGLLGSISVSETLILKGLEVPKKIRIAELRQGLGLQCRLEADRSITIDVKELGVAAPSIELQALPQGNVTTSLDLKGAADTIRLTGLNPVRLDAGRFEARLQLGKFIDAGVKVGARNTGFERLDAEGHTTLRPAELMPLLPPDLGVKGKVDGELTLNWRFSGRLPSTQEVEDVKASWSSKDRPAKRIPFVDQIQLVTSLNHISVDIPGENETVLKIGRIGSKKPFQLTMEEGLLRNRISGELEMEQIESLPVLGDLAQPLKLNLTLFGSFEDFKRISLDETVAVVTLKGAIDAGAQLQVTPDKELQARVWFNSPKLDARVGDLLQVSNFQSHINIEKQYHLTMDGKAASSPTNEKSFLSVQVLEPRPLISQSGNMDDQMARRLADDLQGRFGRQRSLAFDAARLHAGGLNIDLTNEQMEFRLVKGLPVVDYFRMDLLGGSILGSFSVDRAETDFMIRADLAFSGINAKKLMPDTIGGVPDEEAEISGQVSLRAPLLQDVNRFLEDLNLDLDFTRIGSRALERFLFALDPYENNESIVSQRKLLRIGTPRWIKLGIREGNLSLSGEVEAGGARIDLPGIDRVNIANLPKLQGIEKSLSGLGMVISLMRAAGATAITVDSDGRLKFENDRS
ncbi:MAG: AsmA family protein [Deltaproteobacteria bacterium]|nr:AsmA family protein [Deltaproteobacteria bacterium]